MLAICCKTASLEKVLLFCNINLPITPAPPPPSEVAVSQNGLNSLLVNWTPSPGPDVTGYTIFYQQIGGIQNGSVTAGANPSIVNIAGLQIGARYSIYISANSSTLSSVVVAGPVVTIGKKKVCSV